MKPAQARIFAKMAPSDLMKIQIRSLDTISKLSEEGEKDKSSHSVLSFFRRVRDIRAKKIRENFKVLSFETDS